MVVIMSLYLICLIAYVFTDRKTVIPIVHPCDKRVKTYNSLEYRMKEKVSTSVSNSIKKSFKNKRWF